MENEKIRKYLDNAIEKQVPDVWDELRLKINKMEEKGIGEVTKMPSNVSLLKKKRTRYKRLSIAAAVCLIAGSTLYFTPASAAIEAVYNKIFSIDHMDDAGLKNALSIGHAQAINQTFYDKNHDITVQFDSVLTDDKETKLLVTYHSETLNLEHYYIDIFEGKSSINLVVGNNQKKLDNVGWGSRYYDSKQNTVSEALSFDSIKEFEAQDIRLEIHNLTIYKNNNTGSLETVWPLDFKLDKAAVSNRETVELNKQFNFEDQSYTIKAVEYSELETRLVITGTDTKLQTDSSGMKYKVMSKLEHKFLDARKIDKDYGYMYDDQKSGVVLQSAGEKVVPIFSKGEVKGADDEYIMTFAPVKDRHDCVLEIGNDIKVPLSQ